MNDHVCIRLCSGSSVLTEASVSTKLEEFRAKQPKFVSLR